MVVLEDREGARVTARTPEQDEARRTAEEPAGSRQARRRLTFGVAGDLAAMPARSSPWQRAYEAWRAAGLTWGHGAPPRPRTDRPAPADLTDLTEPEPAPAEQIPAPVKPKPAPVKAKGAAG